MNVLVTGGGTIAPIDDVRAIANLSTGNFSAALSEASLRLGANVVHVHAPTAVLPFSRHARLDFSAGESEFGRLRRLLDDWQSAAHRLRLVPLNTGTVADYSETLRRVLRENPVDVAFMAMAVSDFEPEFVPGKIDSTRDGLSLRLNPTPKVIRSVRDWSPSTYLVGFKLTSGASPAESIRIALDACLLNRVDLTIANDVSTLRSGHVVHLVRPGFEAETLGPADDLADRVVERVLEWAASRTDRG